MTCLYFVLQTYLINFEICMLICRLTGDKFNHWTWFREDTSLNTSSHISYCLFGSKTKPEVQETIRAHFGLVTRVANHINDGSVPWRCDSEPACTTPGPANWSSYMEFSCNDLIVNTCGFYSTMTWHSFSNEKVNLCRGTNVDEVFGAAVTWSHPQFITQFVCEGLPNFLLTSSKLVIY